ncbi:MAG: enoyl-CoA hydratase/isomerase family protein [Solirubrobacteraceae bacterium]
MDTDGYTTLGVRVEDGIARATIDHPPINLFDAALIVEMDRFGREAADDPDVRVVVVDSANRDFFIAHADVKLILQLPSEPQPPPTELPLFTAMVDRFRTMPKATIAVIEGRCRGGGSELVLGMDLRFAALGRARLAQPEVTVGIIPGGGGTQRLPRLIGEGRALELIMTGRSVEADEALRIGLVNRLIEGDPLAAGIAFAREFTRYGLPALRLARDAVSRALDLPLHEGLKLEADLSTLAYATDDAKEGMDAFMAKRKAVFKDG